MQHCSLKVLRATIEAKVQPLASLLLFRSHVSTLGESQPGGGARHYGSMLPKVWRNVFWKTGQDAVAMLVTEVSPPVSTQTLALC